jgi:CBS domain-containing protein
MYKLTVNDIMEKHPVYVKVSDLITRARQLMRDFHHRTLPVMDEKNRVIGIITEKEVLNITSTKSNITVNGYIIETPVISEEMEMKQAARIMIETGFTSIPVVDSRSNSLKGIVGIIDIFNNLDPSDIPEGTVSEFMSEDVKTCTQDDSLSKIWMNMIREGFSGYPVVDKQNRPIGMITKYDILSSGGVRIEREDEHGTRIRTSSRVGRIMSTPPFTINTDASLKKAIEMMTRLDVQLLCVVDPEKLVGIIDIHDIVRASTNVRI